jgi:hypothetical protein
MISIVFSNVLEALQSPVASVSRGTWLQYREIVESMSIQPLSSLFVISGLQAEYFDDGQYPCRSLTLNGFFRPRLNRVQVMGYCGFSGHERQLLPGKQTMALSATLFAC